MPVVDYCLNKNRSLAWMKKLIKAVMLFLQYLEAQPEYPEERWRIFSNFARALRLGTFNTKPALGPVGFDPSWLCWSPGGTEVEYYIGLLSDFFDWISRENPEAKTFNPHYKGNSYDQLIDHKAFIYRRSKAFLGHGWRDGNTEASDAHLIRKIPNPKIAKSHPPEFPHERFEELLFKGFRVNGRYNYRDMAITLLLHGAGFRVSEPFHMYMSDVQPHWNDPTIAFVAIHHPRLGLAPSGWQENREKHNRGNRAQYLAEKWAMVSRDDLVDRKFSGWKHPMLDDKYFMQAWWFDPVYGQWFLQIWNEYIKQVVQTDRDNPYAWVNMDRSPKGGMYCLDTFTASHQAAVMRVGLPYGKKYGTTPHGHRHSYAQRLRRAGITGQLLQKFMHHCSPDSQEAYIAPTTKETFEAIAKATELARSQSGIINPNIMPFIESA